jgi:hypothetical protein
MTSDAVRQALLATRACTLPGFGTLVYRYFVAPGGGGRGLAFERDPALGTAGGLAAILRRDRVLELPGIATWRYVPPPAGVSGPGVAARVTFVADAAFEAELARAHADHPSDATVAVYPELAGLGPGPLGAAAEAVATSGDLLAVDLLLGEAFQCPDTAGRVLRLLQDRGPSSGSRRAGIRSLAERVADRG